MHAPKIICLLGLLLCFGCVQDLQDIPDETIGMAPVYAIAEDWDEIFSTAPREIRQLGKIYYKSPYIYATERGEGIHVVDTYRPIIPIGVTLGYRW